MGGDRYLKNFVPLRSLVMEHRPSSPKLRSSAGHLNGYRRQYDAWAQLDAVAQLWYYVSSICKVQCIKVSVIRPVWQTQKEVAAWRRHARLCFFA